MNSLNSAMADLDNFEKVRKALKSAGTTIAAVSWITIFGNLILYFLPKFFPDFPAAFRTDLPTVILITGLSVVFIILGNRIKTAKDKNSKLYLKILLVLFILFFIFIVMAGGKVGVMLGIIIAYSAYALALLSKAMKSEVFMGSLVEPKYRIDKRGWVALVVVILIAFSGAFYYQINGLGYSNEEFIKGAIAENKKISTYPKQISEDLQLTNITSSNPNTVEYNYLVKGVLKINNEELKSNLLSSVCEEDSSKIFFKRDISIGFVYTSTEEAKTVSAIITPEDCK